MTLQSDPYGTPVDPVTERLRARLAVVQRILTAEAAATARLADRVADELSDRPSSAAVGWARKRPRTMNVASLEAAVMEQRWKTVDKALANPVWTAVLEGYLHSPVTALAAFRDAGGRP